MSLWWTKREQLDDDQVELIEKVPLRHNLLVLGPPGSGKTNVLVRRAQFVRQQGMPNVLVLTFTRPLTEFVKTGCIDAQGREIFPRTSVSTLERWSRSLYRQHNEPLPSGFSDLAQWKRALAGGAVKFAQKGLLPKYDTLFVDEGQDLVTEEVELISTWSDVLWFAGDDRQKIFTQAEGLQAIRQIVKPLHERSLPYHYRMAPEICRVADRILLPQGGQSLESTSQYVGPSPATVSIPAEAESREEQLARLSEKLRQQVRVYADLINQGDRLGVIVARRDDRDVVLAHLEEDSALRSLAKIIRSQESGDSYDTSFAPDTPICIVTVAGCKGLEFRAVHWVFSDELAHHFNAEHYYTVVTRAKTSLDVYHTRTLPDILARAHSESGVSLW